MTTPIITSIYPSGGPAAGGTQVAIAGSGLGTATADEVLFGTAPAAAVVGASDSLLTVLSPASTSLGVVQLSVTTPNGNAAWPEGFDYEMSVDSVYPDSGPVAGGTGLTIKGSGFLQITGLQFDATPAATPAIISDIEMTVTTPPAAAPGAVALTFIGQSGQTAFIAFDAFTYTAAAAGGSPSTNGGGTAATTNQPSSTQSTQGQSTQGQSTQAQSTQGQPTQTPSPPSQTSADQGQNAGKTQQPNQTPPNQGPQTQGAQDQGAPKQTGQPQPGQNQPGQTTDQNQGQTTQPGQTHPASQAPGQSTPGFAAAATPTPGDYIPGGAMIVPGGQTGLGTSAGTGQGFGVGTLMAGGGGSAAPSNLSYYNDPGLNAQLVQTLVGLVQSAASPDAIEAQNMILRRMALEGDVVGSRIPPPRNISEFGGYLNLLETLDDKAMREQALAGALGVAGPSVPLGWISNQQPLSMVAVINDRPAVPAQKSFPISVLVRSDFVSGVQNALKTLHSYGATLPLTSPSVIVLPPGGTGATIPNSPLFYLGRTLNIAPSAALSNPQADPVVLVSADGTLGNCVLNAQALNTGAISVAPADVMAVQATTTGMELVQANGIEIVPIAPVLAAAGYYTTSPLPAPGNVKQTSWATLTNTTGLVAGVTQLGDELALLYRQDQIAASAFASMLSWTWNGSAFVSA